MGSRFPFDEMPRSARMNTIVVLGAGYAGIRCVSTLAHARQHGSTDVRLVLIDRSPYHQLITWLHEVASEAIPAERARIPLRQLLPTEHVEFVQAEVTRLLPADRQVLTDRGAFSYDRLVIALGSDTAWPPIPGLREHAFPLRWWNEAVRLRNHIRRQFAIAGRAKQRATRRRHACVVIAGGGFTGCQLAGELAHWLPLLADEYGVPLDDVHLILLEAQSHLLPTWRRWVGRRAERILRSKGVDVRLNTPLERAAKNHIVAGGTTIETYTLIWTGGIQAPALLAESGLPTGSQGRVRTTTFLRVPGFPELYAAGDCALVRDAAGTLLPATAAQALRQGAYVAKALLAEMSGEELEPYRPRHLAMFLSLGGGDAIGDVFGFPVRGRPAGLLKESIERWYHSIITLASKRHAHEEEETE